MISCPQCQSLVVESSGHCPSCGAALSLHGPSISPRYQLRQKIAQGGYGVLYEALSLTDNQRVAIKILHTELLDTENRERFRREVSAIGRLEHPSAIKIYDHGETADGAPWLSMELLEGESLYDLLARQGTLSAPELLSVLGPICEVLAEAHQKGILHRDLKAHHIILLTQRDGSILPKLIDFGLAAMLDAETLTQSGMIAGTPQYMAPEQWEGLRNADERTDIYALGMIAYQCLTGRLPFEANTLLEWMQKHYYEEPMALSAALQGRAVSGSLMDAIQKAISKQPQDRQQSIAELQRDIFLEAYVSNPALQDEACPGGTDTSDRRNFRAH